MESTRRQHAGRPASTSHAEIEQVAFGLFADVGFSETTVDDIAAAVGVARRTLFRYFDSKNDIPWGRFAETLQQFEQVLDETPVSVPVHEAVHRAVLDFNRFPDDASPSHRDRMRLILTTPELQAHSVHQYAAWRAIIANYVAKRLGLLPSDMLPVMVGQISLALALASYEIWLQDEHLDLVDVIDRAMSALQSYLGTEPAP